MENKNMENEISLMDLANAGGTIEENSTDPSKANISIKEYKKIDMPIVDDLDKKNRENTFSKLEIIEEGDEALYTNPNKNYGRYKDAADKGDIDAAYKLAMVYKTDKKTNFDKNPKEQAAKYFEIAANGGNSKAAYNLAFYYLNGDGVEKDEKKALEYFKQAPDDKIFIEGICRIADKNIEENRELAIKLYEIAIEKYADIIDLKNKKILEENLNSLKSLAKEELLRTNAGQDINIY